MTRPHLLLASLIVLLSATSSLSQCLPSHRDALLRLKSGFTNSSTILSSWNPTVDCCSWVGVTCGNGSAEVTALDLSGLFLSGKVDPVGLFSLTSLTSLNLAFNNLNFNETLSAQVGFEVLVKLTNLNLSYSGFAGQIPMVVSALTNLVSLDFSNPFAVPRIVLKNPNLQELVHNLSKLEVLYLDGVIIATNGPDWCSALSYSVPNLQKLSLVACNLTGGRPANAAHHPILKFLTVLRLDQNNFDSEMPLFLGNMSSLEVIGVSYCGLNGSIPESISKLRNLTSLDVSNNPKLGGNLPNTIGELTSLKMLLISNCRLNGSIPASIGRLVNLVKLDLSNNSLTGELPQFDSDSISISEIHLADNKLNGSIPSSYGRLLNLTVLDIHDNFITGSIPVSLFRLPMLKTMDLHQNALSGSLDELINAPLETVDMSRNNLKGPIPNSIFKLSSLKVLLLANNNFSGTVHLELLHGLQNLSTLDLSYNRLIVTEPQVSYSLPNIRTLKLAHCSIWKFPVFLKDKKNMVNLDLSMNNITGEIPSWLWGIGHNSLSLSQLNLSHNQFTGFERPLFDPLKSTLRVLDLHNNMLQGPILLPPALSSVVDYSNNNFSSSIPLNISLYLNFTIFFSISNNKITGIIPQSFCHSSFLQVLDLSLNNLNGTIPLCLSAMKSLSVLNLRGNNLSGFMPSNFSEGCNLRTLNLNQNQLRGSLPQSLSNCKMLEVLDVGNNHMDGQFPSWLGSLTGLRVLILRSNNFGGRVKAVSISNSSFGMLQIIDLSSNNFSGHLSNDHFTNLKAMTLSSEESSRFVQFSYLNLSGLLYQDTVMITSKGLEMTLVKILTVYTSIDISNNKFEGTIPDAVGELNALIVLNMSHNLLTGPIPGTFGNLKQLESLDLSFNNLSGQIPQELNNLTFLSFLNLSYNNLSGEIPLGRQLRTFSNASFFGNSKLCGYPLSVNCSLLSNLEDSRHAIELNWKFIFVGLGLGSGLALVAGPCVLCRKWRKLFNKYTDEILLAIFPSCFWVWASCGGGRVDAEEKMEDEFEWADKAREHPFCVFCTGLEFNSGQPLIHHRECTCTREDK